MAGGACLVLVVCLVPVACLVGVLVACLLGVACLVRVACLVLVAWVLPACLVGPVGASKLGQLEARQEAGHQAHRDGQRNRPPPFSSRPYSAQL